jgi:hypothetical protein
MTSEEMARLEIDRQLQPCDWIVQDGKETAIPASRGAVARDFSWIPESHRAG